MIIRIQASGSSFRGAGAYYLHDKAADGSIDNSLKPTSAERVMFTETRNCANQDPFRALDEMWFVADNQDWLKMQAGVKRGGRAVENPVKTIVMSWHAKDEPSTEHMIESADAFLRHMGWQEHQAVIAGHDDTDHKHLHIILNRVHPDNGRTLDDYKERVHAQEWALQYERARDQVRCDHREANAEKRQGRGKDNEAALVAANDHLPHNVIALTREHERQFTADELQRAGQDAEARKELKLEQREERQAFFADGAKLFKATRVAAYKEVREEFKAEWRELYKDAKAAGHAAEIASDDAIKSAVYLAYTDQWERARTAFDSRHDVRDHALEKLLARKADLVARQTAAISERQHEACDSLREVREIQYQELLKRQAAERASLQAGQTLDAADVRQERDRDASAMLWAQVPANENATGSEPHTGRHASEIAMPLALQQAAAVIAREAADERGARIDLPKAAAAEHQATGPTHQLADLAAGAIGSVASYLADQLGELFAPTPPEVREARAKAEAKQEAQQQVEKAPESEFDKILAATIRSVEAERSREDTAYWKERDRGKGWERDQ
mgnify:FL=1